MLKNVLLNKSVWAAIVAALIAVFAALPWTTGVKYTCIVQNALGEAPSTQCEQPMETVEDQ